MGTRLKNIFFWTYRTLQTPRKSLQFAVFWVPLSKICYDVLSAVPRGVADGEGGRGVLTPALLKKWNSTPPDSRMKWPKSGVFPIFRVFRGRLATLPTIRPPHSKIRGDAPCCTPKTFHNTINKNVNYSNDTIDNLNQSNFHKPARQCQGHLRT